MILLIVAAYFYEIVMDWTGTVAATIVAFPI
jgi:hypothetical protein